MVYQSPTRSTLGTGLAVAAIHVVIGAALLATFAGGTITAAIRNELRANNWTYVPPPAPRQPKAATHAATASNSTITAPQPEVPGLGPTGAIVLGTLPAMLPMGNGDGGILSDIPERPVKPALPPVAAHPLGNPGAWITPDDYPSRALREGWSGVTRLHLVIGGDGRVEACSVIASSGHGELDAVACAKVTERARFTPARDSTGAERDGTYDGAIRWQINEISGD
jgi:protein TonB